MENAALNTALTAILLSAALLIHDYPAEWKKDRIIRAVLFALHVTGSVCLILLFLFWYRIPEGFFKHVIQFLATFYFMEMFCTAWYLLLGRLYLFFCRRTGHEKNRLYRLIRAPKRNIPFITVLVLLLTLAGYINMDFLKTTDYSVRIDKPAASQELRAAVISDIHLGGGMRQNETRRLAEKTDACNPQVIFILGDLADETTSAEDLLQFQESFSRLRPEYGIYYIYGNHDRKSHFAVEPFLQKAGIRILNDEAVTFSGITLIGRNDGEQDKAGLEEIIRRTGAGTASPVILLEHRPRGLAELSGTGCDLVLCGHTHGYRYPVSGLMRFFYSPLAGLKNFGPMKALTTTGAATWGMRFKFPSSNEIAVLNISFRP